MPSDLTPIRVIPSRRTLGRRILDTASNIKEKLKSELAEVKHICLTADIWSTKHRSFFGVTVHWVSIWSYLQYIVKIYLLLITYMLCFLPYVNYKQIHIREIVQYCQYT